MPKSKQNLHEYYMMAETCRNRMGFDLYDLDDEFEEEYLIINNE